MATRLSGTNSVWRRKCLCGSKAYFHGPHSILSCSWLRQIQEQTHNCNTIMCFIFNLQRKKKQPEIASNVDIYAGTTHNECKLLILITMEPICLQEYSRRGHKCSSMLVPMSLVYWDHQPCLHKPNIKNASNITFRLGKSLAAAAPISSSTQFTHKKSLYDMHI